MRECKKERKVRTREERKSGCLLVAFVLSLPFPQSPELDSQRLTVQKEKNKPKQPAAKKMSSRLDHSLPLFPCVSVSSFISLLFLLCLNFSCVSAAPSKTAATSRLPTFHLIPHSHCDPGWLQSFEGYYLRDVRVILDGVVQTLIADSSRRFIWAETCVICVFDLVSTILFVSCLFFSCFYLAVLFSRDGMKTKLSNKNKNSNPC